VLYAGGCERRALATTTAIGQLHEEEHGQHAPWIDGVQLPGRERKNGSAGQCGYFAQPLMRVTRRRAPRWCWRRACTVCGSIHGRDLMIGQMRAMPSFFLKTGTATQNQCVILTFFGRQLFPALASNRPRKGCWGLYRAWGIRTRPRLKHGRRERRTNGPSAQLTHAAHHHMSARMSVCVCGAGSVTYINMYSSYQVCGD